MGGLLRLRENRQLPTSQSRRHWPVEEALEDEEKNEATRTKAIGIEPSFV